VADLGWEAAAGWGWEAAAGWGWVAVAGWGWEAVAGWGWVEEAGLDLVVVVGLGWEAAVDLGWEAGAGWGWEEGHQSMLPRQWFRHNQPPPHTWAHKAAQLSESASQQAMGFCMLQGMNTCCSSQPEARCHSVGPDSPSGCHRV